MAEALMLVIVRVELTPQQMNALAKELGRDGLVLRAQHVREWAERLLAECLDDLVEKQVWSEAHARTAD